MCSDFLIGPETFLVIFKQIILSETTFSKISLVYIFGLVTLEKFLP